MSRLSDLSRYRSIDRLDKILVLWVILLSWRKLAQVFFGGNSAEIPHPFLIFWKPIWPADKRRLTKFEQAFRGVAYKW